MLNSSGCASHRCIPTGDAADSLGEETARCAQANDIAGCEDANATLHEVIYLASGNPFIAEQAQSARLAHTRLPTKAV